MTSELELAIELCCLVLFAVERGTGVLVRQGTTQKTAYYKSKEIRINIT